MYGNYERMCVLRCLASEQVKKGELTQVELQVELSFQYPHFLSHRGHMTICPPMLSLQISLLQREREKKKQTEELNCGWVKRDKIKKRHGENK